MKPIEWLGDSVRYIDQTRLPLEELHERTTDYRQIVDAICALKIRGAPLIGISAAYGVALASLHYASADIHQLRQYLHNVIGELRAARPTAVNLRWALEKMEQVVSSASDIEQVRRDLIDAAIAIHKDDAERCERIGGFGVALIPQNACVLTHCNTGALATGGEGTALSVIKKAYRFGRIKHVFVDETRPLLQGARLTTWELAKENIPFTLITDNMAASLMKDKKIDVIITGADRIAANGDAANKIGTYSLAVLAQHHAIPFYIAAPMSTIDPAMQDGSQIPIEQRSPLEVTHVFGKQIAPDGTSVYNPAFDVTPAGLIAAIITDQGVFRSPYDFTTHH
jgi:methylthioribose-1-phosphate isomerase